MTPFRDEEGHKRLKMLEKCLSRLESAGTRLTMKHRRRNILGLTKAFSNYVKREFPIPRKERDTKKQAEEALRLMIKRFAKTYKTSWHPEKGAVRRLKMLTDSLDYTWYHVKPTDYLMAAVIFPTFKKRFERWQERYKNVILLEKAGQEG